MEPEPRARVCARAKWGWLSIRLLRPHVSFEILPYPAAVLLLSCSSTSISWPRQPRNPFVISPPDSRMIRWQLSGKPSSRCYLAQQTKATSSALLKASCSNNCTLNGQSGCFLGSATLHRSSQVAATFFQSRKERSYRSRCLPPGRMGQGFALLTG
jgi:hypothetical protein